MMRALVPILLAVVALVGGVGAGYALRPASEAEEAPAPAADTAHDYVKLSNQFVVPVLNRGRVTAMVILSLSLETVPDSSATVYAREPKLRDSFLKVLFDHANTGGFDNSFTDADNLVVLRRSLLEAAQRVLGDIVSDVLIVDIMRQDA
ncbi:flagellar basal body-associated FliL family protein [Falsirhodobacter algicola]|uniref:Flagellar basal body-associated protein FliL n=1 Tax=Falsirhodobacter algicola TaxID=2692330 RepID=A0A8J8SLY7_9RHOB|nr:flagellar basal body-associated FliL family protein [Falsirhodobacter algicola]QUS36914.1 flagellar basal body-associated protein FliL [Falsirhodobacter algicola]